MVFPLTVLHIFANGKDCSICRFLVISNSFWQERYIGVLRIIGVFEDFVPSLCVEVVRAAAAGKGIDILEALRWLFPSGVGFPLVYSVGVG